MHAHCHRDDNDASKALWDTLRKGRPRQLKEAQDLHGDAGVPKGPCGVEELNQFQQALGNQYQLLVMSFCKPFMLIFKGPPAPHQIRLVKANAHYHGCTSFPAFVNRAYYCVECEKGFNEDSVKQHSCKSSKCKSCNRKSCPDYKIGTIPALRCPKCNGLFFGGDCLLFHRTGKTCGTFRTCPKYQWRYCFKEGKRHKCE